MSTVNKDFKVKNGIQVSEGGSFGGPVAVGTPTDPSHAVTKEYLDSALALLAIADGGSLGEEYLDGGSANTVSWTTVFDGGNV